jgi:hypothetical protein
LGCLRADLDVCVGCSESFISVLAVALAMIIMRNQLIIAVFIIIATLLAATTVNTHNDSGCNNDNQRTNSNNAINGNVHSELSLI